MSKSDFDNVNLCFNIDIVPFWHSERGRMGPGDKFCLQWNDFEKNISEAFKELREEKDFFDVTIACEENEIQAHKLILAACSPFFR